MLLHFARRGNDMAYDPSNTEKKTILHSPSMIQIFQKANLLAYNQASVLIYGESGVGKSFLAEYIQKSGSLSKKPFVKISCNAISEELFASELFGYSPNAFTGASSKGKIGLLEAADQGTVLFDEINELSPHCQTLLLHFLQNKNITPIGSLVAKEIHTRIICTSGQNLREMIKAGTFRSDLYYRIRVANIHIPPLRERKDEIPLFLRFFIERYAEEYNCPMEKQLISEEQMAALSELEWKGNIREISNLAQQICLSENQGELIDAFIHARCTPLYALGSTVPSVLHPANLTSVKKPFSDSAVFPDPSALPPVPLKPLKEALREFEAAYIKQALEQSGTLKEAADVLGISFSTLCRKKAELGISKNVGSGQKNTGHTF